MKFTRKDVSGLNGTNTIIKSNTDVVIVIDSDGLIKNVWIKDMTRSVTAAFAGEVVDSDYRAAEVITAAEAYRKSNTIPCSKCKATVKYYKSWRHLTKFYCPKCKKERIDAMLGGKK